MQNFNSRRLEQCFEIHLSQKVTTKETAGPIPQSLRILIITTIDMDGGTTPSIHMLSASEQKWSGID